MNPWPIVRAFLVRHRWTALAFVFLVAAGVSLAVALVSQERALRTGSARAADRFDLIVAAPGSQIDVLLTAVFLRPGTTKLLAPDVTARLLNDQRAAFVAPIGFGDSHRGASHYRNNKPARHSSIERTAGRPGLRPSRGGCRGRCLPR